ncbi:hypothetical protein BJF93_10115 [Xaviernesmea oryzae]|uniref:Uncharacterized protein n=1 Tax=Xaviernesmea oryzae TaxID=464029 RepID=A0A1Q9AWW5_9HYPH|nr:hypothetical protein [Xaviernesmea oryzae]OLP59941.1 hypothetical protein BJF93_10115 [Xaviernesmea oryzae]SEK43929.1 hypothetical protein SAMN04487976_102188 [Xaviernesmea oryzae]
MRPSLTATTSLARITALKIERDRDELLTITSRTQKRLDRSRDLLHATDHCLSPYPTNRAQTTTPEWTDVSDKAH